MLEKFRVLLPKWIFSNAKSNQEMSDLVEDYMQRYPHYAVIKIENGFAICERVQMDKK